MPLKGTMEQTTCEDCRYNQGGRCHDRTAYGMEGGDLPADDSPRLCYEALPLTLCPDGVPISQKGGGLHEFALFGQTSHFLAQGRD